MKKQILAITALSCASALTASAALAQEQEPTRPAFLESPGFSVFADFASRQISRGLPDNEEPVATFGFSAEWYGLSFEVDWLYDLTDERNLDGEYNEIDYIIGYGYAFSPDDWKLPTTIELAADWTYEYHPDDPFTHYIHASIGLPDLWLAPTLESEFEMRDSCRYFSLSFSHSWNLIEAREEDADPILSLTLSVAQGLANAKQNEADLGKDFWSLRDTTFTAQLDWTPVENITISPYIAYGDTYSGAIRKAAHYYTDGETRNDVSQVYGGIAIAATF
ncbi:MAG: hypothetical protein ACI4QT_02065 [Kiritimatiellia bacterium]